MKLSELLKKSGLEVSASLLHSIEANEFQVESITSDSRKVKPGFIFVAVQGLEHDGHEHIEQAVINGAKVIVFDVNSKFQIPNPKPANIEFIGVNNSRRSLGLLWAAWYYFPADKMKVIGITGTDGKTTTANLLYHILKESGKKVGLISTINARIGDREIDTGFHVTSPDPELLQKLLSEMVKEDLEYVVLEVTSHGIDQERIAGVKFVGAAITNVTHEHLDYHKTYQSYLQTKAVLFKNVNFAVLNSDDESFDYLKSKSDGKIVSYGLKNISDFMAENPILKGAGSFWELLDKADGRQAGIHLNLPGLYNISNALAATSLARQLGLELTEIKLALETFSPLAGRFEMIDEGQDFKVIVDFAHTPNALEQVLKICSQLTTQNSKLISVFGCAGERDTEKRPMMGEIAGRMADLIIITAEDPRRESLTDIINYISEGCLRAGAKEMSEVRGQRLELKADGRRFFIRIPNRREAIEMAISEAQKDDIVLITGKGHEKSMCFGVTEYPWSDQKVAREALHKVKSRL